MDEKQMAELITLRIRNGWTVIGSDGVLSLSAPEGSPKRAMCSLWTDFRLLVPAYIKTDRFEVTQVGDD